MQVVDDMGDTGERPFGQIEGAYAEIRTMRSGFIEFGSNFGGLSLRPDEQDVRILVGRMGTGKSINLRRLHEYSKSDLEDKVYTAAFSRQAASALTTANVKYFCNAFDASELTEMWKLLWRRAILRATISHLIHPTGLASYVRNAEILTLRGRDQLLSDQTVPTDIATEAQMIIETLRQRHPHSKKNTTRDAILAFLQSSRWAKIEYELFQALEHCPPMFFYVDAIDDEFRAAPSYWLRAQKGLFYEIYHLLRETRLREKIHVVAAIRDLVLSSVYQSEHGHRYLNENHHRVLKWTDRSIRVFLRRKIEDLDERWQMQPGASSEVGLWLGTDQIVNEVRGISENLESYLVRHTRTTPRDIVQLGNQLCAYIGELKSMGQPAIDPRRVRQIVSRAAADAARFELNHCAHQIETDLANQSGNYAHYQGQHEYPYADTGDTLRRLIAEAKTDRLNWNVVSNLRRRGRNIFESADLDLPTILWQNGLLGYVDDSRHRDPARAEMCVFYSEPTVGSAVVPQGHGEYILHPILLDAIPDLVAAGPPILPGLSTDR